MSRPSLGKSASLYLTLTPAEKEQIMQLAAAAGISISAFVLGCCLGDRLGGAIKGEGFTSTSEAFSRRLPDSPVIGN